MTPGERIRAVAPRSWAKAAFRTPDYYRRLGSKGGRRTSELHGKRTRPTPSEAPALCELAPPTPLAALAALEAGR